MGGEPLLIVLIAAGIGLFVTLLQFGVGPAPIRSLFFNANGEWRRFGRAGVLFVLVGVLLLAALATWQRGAGG